MLKASFPMYNIPEIRAAQSALWKGIATHLKSEGVEEVPDDLAHDCPLAALLSDKNMLISQCCGYDIVQRYRETLVLVAAPIFDVAECSGHEYSSLIVVAEGSPYQDVLDMRGSIAAANGPESHSGMSSLRHLVAPKSLNGSFFGSVIYSGGHVQSLHLIQSGKADVAAIDSVTYTLLERYRPSATESIRKLGRTFFAPAPPYVTHIDRESDTLRRLKIALQNAFRDPDLEACRTALLLKGIGDVDRKTYEKILDFEVYATKLGYPELR